MATFNIIIEQDEDSMFISEVFEVPGCHTQAKTLDELLIRTKEAILLCLKYQKAKEVKEKFLGLQQIEI